MRKKLPRKQCSSLIEHSDFLLHKSKRRLSNKLFFSGIECASITILPDSPFIVMIVYFSLKLLLYQIISLQHRSSIVMVAGLNLKI